MGAAITKHHRLKQQKFISSQFLSIGVQNQGIRMASFHGLSPWLVGGCLLPVS